MAISDVRLQFLRKEARRKGGRGDLAEVVLREPDRVPRRLELVREIDAHEAGVIGVQGDGDAFEEEAPRGVFGNGRHSLREPVRGGTHLERHAAFDGQSGDVGIPRYRQPMPEPCGFEHLDRLPHMCRWAGLAVVDGETKARIAQRRNGFGVHRRREPDFRSGDVETNQVLTLPQGERDRLLAGLDAVIAAEDRNEPHGHIHPVGFRLPSSVHDRLHRAVPIQLAGLTQELRREAELRHRDALGRQILDRFVGDTSDRVEGPYRVLGDRERRQRGFQVLHRAGDERERGERLRRLGRKPDASRSRQLEDRLQPDRPFEVTMELDLRQGAQVPEVDGHGISPCRIFASFEESRFPPDTTHTTLPGPALPSSAAATEVPPAPSATTRLRSTMRRIALATWASETTSERPSLSRTSSTCAMAGSTPVRCRQISPRFTADSPARWASRTTRARSRPTCGQRSTR